ncbi:unnamed protein product, partial [marine sediment metagenome]
DDIGDIDPEEENSGTVSFTVDEDVDDNTYDMEIDVEGDDEHGAKHGERWEIDFDVEKKTHDIIIKSASISDEAVSCMRGDNSIQVKLINIGKKDEDEVSLYVKNTNLALDFEKEDLEIDEGDDYIKTISFTVPEDMKSGTYSIRVSAYYSGDEDDGVLGDMKDIDLTVSTCAVTEPTTPVTTPSDVTTTPSGDVEVTVPEDVLEEFGITETEEDKPFRQSAGFIVLLTVLVMGALGGVTVLVIYLVKGQ